jgi:hypothetical protein
MTGDLRKSTVFLLLDGDCQSHHRCYGDSIAYAISVHIANSMAQEASRYGCTQHQVWLSTLPGILSSPIDLGMLASEAEPKPSPYTDRYCYPIKTSRI